MSYSSSLNVNANLTEMSMLVLLLEAGMEPVAVPVKYWFRLIKRSCLNKTEVEGLWNKRLELAAPHLIKKDFGHLVQDEDFSLVERIDWERVPNELFVDMVLGLNCLVQQEDGTILGVDVTTTEDEEIVKEKKANLNWLKPMLQHLGVDAVVVAQVKFDEFGFEALEPTHKKLLIKGMKKTLNKDFSTKWLHRWSLDMTAK